MQSPPPSKKHPSIPSNLSTDPAKTEAAKKNAEHATSQLAAIQLFLRKKAPR